MKWLDTVWIQNGKYKCKFLLKLNYKKIQLDEI